MSAISNPQPDVLNDLAALADGLCLHRDTVCAAFALEQRIVRLQALRDAVIDGTAQAVYRGAPDDRKARVDPEHYAFQFVRRSAPSA
jgi:hypothetical protein